MAQNCFRPDAVSAAFCAAIRLIRSTVATAICIGLIAPATGEGADPSTTSPDEPLMAHDTIPGAKQKIAVMYERFTEWEKLAITSTEAANAGKRFPHQKLSQTYPDLFRGVWYAKQLQAMGEPAGYDLEHKFTQLKLAYNVFASRLREFQQKEILKLRKDDKRRAETIARATKLANEGKFAEAEKLIQTFHLKQLSSIFYLTHTQASPFETPVNPLHMKILDGLVAQQRKENAKTAGDKLSEQDAAFERLQSEAKRLVDEIQASGKVQLPEDQTGDVADAVGYLGDLWAQSSAANSRSSAIAWAFGLDHEDSLRKHSEASATLIAATVGELIKSAGQSMPAEQVQQVIPRLLREIAILRRQCVGDWGDDLQSQIDQLAASNPTVADQRKVYREAVTEPMRWMRRYARQKADYLSKGYPEASNLLGAKHTPPADSRPPIYKPAGTRERVLTPDTLSQPVSWLAGEAKLLVGEKCRTDESYRISETAPIAIVRENGRIYSSLDLKFDIGAELKAMEELLLVSRQHPALIIEAAESVTSARRLEFTSSGGTIAKLTAEPIVSRLAALPNMLHALAPLNRSPASPESGNMTEHLLWRVDVKCDWVAHELFATAVEKTAGLAGSPSLGR